MTTAGRICPGSIGVLRPGIVHRIDMDTTGVLIACKNDQAHNSIAAQLKEHSITRRYQAIVHGVVKEDEGVVDAPIGRHPQDRKKMCINHQNGKSAVTHYRVLKRFSALPILSAVWKRAVPIRSVSIWRAWDTLCWETWSMDRPGAV